MVGTASHVLRVSIRQQEHTRAPVVLNTPAVLLQAPRIAVAAAKMGTLGPQTALLQPRGKSVSHATQESIHIFLPKLKQRPDTPGTQTRYSREFTIGALLIHKVRVEVVQRLQQRVKEANLQPTAGVYPDTCVLRKDLLPQ